MTLTVLILSVALILCGIGFALMGWVHTIIGRHIPWFACSAACFATVACALAFA